MTGKNFQIRVDDRPATDCFDNKIDAKRVPSVILLLVK